MDTNNNNLIEERDGLIRELTFLRSQIAARNSELNTLNETKAQVEDELIDRKAKLEAFIESEEVKIKQLIQYFKGVINE